MPEPRWKRDRERLAEAEALLLRTMDVSWTTDVVARAQLASDVNAFLAAGGDPDA